MFCLIYQDTCGCMLFTTLKSSLVSMSLRSPLPVTSTFFLIHHNRSSSFSIQSRVTKRWGSQSLIKQILSSCFSISFIILDNRRKISSAGSWLRSYHLIVPSKAFTNLPRQKSKFSLRMLVKYCLCFLFPPLHAITLLWEYSDVEMNCFSLPSSLMYGSIESDQSNVGTSEADPIAVTIWTRVSGYLSSESINFH